MSNTPYNDSANPDVEATGRQLLLPDIYKRIPAWQDLATAMDQVLGEQVDEPALMYLNLRDIHRDSDRWVLKATSSMLGFSKKSYYMDEERLDRLVAHLPKYRSQNTTDAYKKFLSFVAGRALGVDELWTDDYFCFFSVPYGPQLIDDLGNKLEEEQPWTGWFNTTHVLLRANARAIFPNSKTPYEDMRNLFYSIAPGYLVLDFIGNIADLFQTTLELNVGVIEGHTIDEQRYKYENLYVAGTDWKQGRDLPWARHRHAQSRLDPDSVLISGGQTSEHKVEDTAFLMVLEQGSWVSSNAPTVFLKEARVTCFATCPPRAQIMAGTDQGELGISTDGGMTWTKVWSPFFNSKRPITGLCWSSEHGLWLATTIDGYYAVAEDPTQWNDEGGVRCIHKAVSDFNEQEFATDDYVPSVVVNGVVSGNSLFIIYCDDGKVYSSVDAASGSANWKFEETGEPFDIYAGVYDQDRARFLLVGECGWGWLTNDGQNFQSIDVGVGDNDVTWASYIPAGLVEGQQSGRYVIGGRNNTFAVSDDGTLWSLCDPFFRDLDITAGGYLPFANVYFAAGYGRYALSSDSINWNLFETPFLTQYTDTGDSGFVTVVPQSWAYLQKDRRLVVGCTGAAIFASAAQEKFYAAAPLPEPRAAHAQVPSVGGAGSALVVGGVGPDQVATDTVFEYDQITDSWTTLGSLPDPRHSGALVSIPDGLSADNWTLRASRFGIVDILDTVYCPVLDNFWAVGRVGRVATSDYGIKWQLQTSPFPSAQFVGASYNPWSGRISVAVNTIPDKKMLIASSMDGGLSWTSLELTPEYAGIDTLLAFKRLERQPPDLRIVGRRPPVAGIVPSAVPVCVVNETANAKLWASEDFTAVNPAANLRLKDCFCSFYSKAYERHFIGSYGGVYYSDDRGVSWKWGDAAPATIWDGAEYQKVPIVAITENPITGMLIGFLPIDTGLSDIVVSRDAGRTWAVEADTVIGTGPNPTGALNMDGLAWLASRSAVYSTMQYLPVAKTYVVIAPTHESFWSGDDGQTWTDLALTPTVNTTVSAPVDSLVLSDGLTILTLVQAIANPASTQITGTVFLADGAGVDTSASSTLLNDASAASLCMTDARFATSALASTVFIGGSGYFAAHALGTIGGGVGLLGGDSIPLQTMVPSLLGSTGISMFGTLTFKFVAGTMATQTVRYIITAIDGLGETLPSTPIEILIPESTEGAGVEIDWNVIPDASGYRVYKQLDGIYGLIATIPSGTIDFWVDDGSLVPNVEILPPTADTTGLLGIPNWSIARIRYCVSSSTLVAVTTGGFIVWSKNGNQWIGVKNSAVGLSGNPYAEDGGLGQVTDLLVHESSDKYVATANNGGLFISDDGVSFNNAKSNLTFGDITDIGYSPERDQVVLSTENSAIVISSSYTTLTSYGPLDVVATIKEDTIATGFSSSSTVNYTYFIYKRRLADRSGRSYPVLVSMASTGNSFIELTWEHEVGVTHYDIYRMESVADAAPDYTSDNVMYMGQLEPPAEASGITTITYQDRNMDMSLVPPVFEGIGVNDIEIDGSAYDVTALVYRIFKVEVTISKQWSPDTISIERADGPPSAPRDIGTLSSPITFQLGAITTTAVKVWWATDTGHTEGDRWEFWVYPEPKLVGSGIGTLPFINSSYQDLFSIVTYAFTPSSTIPNACRWYSNPITGMKAWLALCPSGTILKSLDFRAITWSVLDTSQSPALTGANIRDMSSALVGPLGARSYVSVLVGDDRFLASTTDIFSVPIRASAFQGFTDDILSVSFNETTKKWTAAGADSCIGHSSDGSTWKMVYESSILTTWRAVAQGQGLYATMVVGDNGAFSTSFDGVLWTLRNIGYTTADINVILTHPSNTERAMILAGSKNTAMYSVTQGLTNTWLRAALPAPGLPGYSAASDVPDITGGCFSINENGSVRWLLCTSIGAIYFSTNLVSWSWRGLGLTLQFSSITAKPESDICIAVCSNTNAVYRTLDQGLTWARIAADSPVLPLFSGFTDIAYDPTGSTIIATSFDGKLARSVDDGVTWEIITIPTKPWSSRKYDPNNPELIDFISVVASPTNFVVAGSEGDILVSDDATGAVFTLKDSKLNGQALNSLSYGAQTYIGAGDRGALVTSFAQFSAQIMYIGGVDDVGTVAADCYVYDSVLDTWNATSDSLATARYDHSGSVLSDGTVIVAGGCDDLGNPLVSVERYLPHRSLWVADVALPYAKGWLRSEIMSTDAYVAFGGGPDPDRSALVLLPAMVVPAPPSLTVGPGILGPGTYFYRISVATTAGETVPTNQVQIQLTEAGGVVIDWEPVPNAVFYCIYGRSEGAVPLIAKVPGHLTAYTDFGVNLTSAQIFRREDTTEDGWFELMHTMPLSRENCAVSMINDDLIVVTGGYKDRRVFRIEPQPANYIDPLKKKQLLLLNYVLDGYWAPDYVTELP